MIWLKVGGRTSWHKFIGELGKKHKLTPKHGSRVSKKFRPNSARKLGESKFSECVGSGGGPTTPFPGSIARAFEEHGLLARHGTEFSISNSVFTAC